MTADSIQRKYENEGHVYNEAYQPTRRILCIDGEWFSGISKFKDTCLIAC